MITFELIEVENPLLEEKMIADWLERLSLSYEKEIGELTYYFCNDDYILEANQKYLAHNYYTDVITFDASQDNILFADILVSVDTVRSNAEKYQVSFLQELHRVLAHAVLHLVGFDDKNKEMQEQMRAEEERALRMLKEEENGN